jgi:glucose/arabinose dehydrogenase
MGWSRFVVVLVVVASAACGAPDDAPATVRLEHVVDVAEPSAMAARRGDPALYVTRLNGLVVAVRDGKVSRVLDLRSEVSWGGEQGLLGLTFSPDGSHLYVNYTDKEGDTRVVEYSFGNGEVQTATRRDVLRVRQPGPNHNGGQLAFGPDGMLYIGLGDGGVRGRTAQSFDVLLGKVLRIDPTPSDGAAYSIPRDNPFVGQQDARGEIWAYGLRNPWRFSFDRATGDLWIGDVGEGRFEEIDLALAPAPGRGANYGWNVREGSARRGKGRPAGSGPIDPLVALPHTTGDCAVVGGYVYRGRRIPDLRGTYVYTDYCNGELRWIRQRDGEVTASGMLDLSLELVTSFGQDRHGELYVLSREEGIFELTPG